MDSIIQVSGLIKFPITIDPTVWIFDDRKLTEETLFSQQEDKNTLEEYTKEASKHWDREITQGAKLPEKQTFKKVALITGTFYMPLSPFIQNSEPTNKSKNINISTTTQNFTFPLSILDDMYLLFCKQGKPLTYDGPVHLYLRSKGRDQKPIKNIQTFHIS